MAATRPRPTPTDPDTFYIHAGVLFFSGDDGSDDYLYTWDGTNFTKIVGGPGSAPIPDDPEYFVSHNGVLYFSAETDREDEIEHLWSLRTAATPVLAATGADSSIPLGIAGAALLAGALALLVTRRARAVAAR